MGICESAPQIADSSGLSERAAVTPASAGIGSVPSIGPGGVSANGLDALRWTPREVEQWLVDNGFGGVKSFFTYTNGKALESCTAGVLKEMGLPPAAVHPLLVGLDGLFHREQRTSVPLGAALMTVEKFSVEDVQPFHLPSSSSSSSSSSLSPNDSAEFIFFLSHRGPDTKEVLVSPLSFVLARLGLPHFFDQSDDAMKLGKVNSDQMAHAAWRCHVGVVILSEGYAESQWCLRELNTFLKRLHLDPNKAVLLPVYYSDHLMTRYKQLVGHLSSVLRKREEAAHEFLITLVPRLLKAPDIQHLNAVQKAQRQLSEDPFLVKRLWNEFALSSVQKTEHKLFVDPNPARGDMERIKRLHKALTPTDINAGLEVYQPLEYSLTPPSTAKEMARYSLDSIVLDLLSNKPITLGRVVEDNSKPLNEQKQIASKLIGGSTIVGVTLQSSEPLQVLLIQGAAGSGKSLFGWHLCSRYYSPNIHVSSTLADSFGAMPLFVSLPMFRHILCSPGDPRQLLSQYFSKAFGLSELVHLQQQPLVLILDGLDELGSKINLYRECDLHLWIKSTFIITCRSEFLQESDISQYITPSNPLDGKPAHTRLGKLWLLPFSTQQRSEYVTKFAMRYQPIYGWKAQQYVAALQRVPELSAFLQEPLLLFMVLSVLPELDLGGKTSLEKGELRRLDPYFLDIAPVSEIKWLFPQIRRAELYALFLTSWVKRETSRLPIHVGAVLHQPSVGEVMDFCCQLAFEMFLRTRTSVNVFVANKSDASVDIKPTASLSLREERALKASKQLSSSSRGMASDDWANKLFADHAEERLCSPLRRSGDGQYSFLHKSLQEYLIALHIANELTQLVVRNDDDGCWFNLLQSSSAVSMSTASTQPELSPTTLSTLLLSQKRLISDYAVIRFAAELVDQRARFYRLPISASSSSSPSDFKSASSASDAVNYQPFGRALFDILLANRHPVACANAITILNASGVGFFNRDFSGLDLSSDLYIRAASAAVSCAADLSGANLYGCNLRESQLRNVRLECACLDGADLRGADLRNTSFGQSSTLKGHTEGVWALALSSDGLTLFSGADDKTICQWSVESGSLMRVLSGHKGGVNCLSLSSDSNTLFSASDDKTICRWSVATGSLDGVFKGHSGPVLSLVLSSDNKTLFSSSSDKTICEWSLDSASPLRVFKGHTHAVKCLVLSSDDMTLYSASEDNTVGQWSIDTGLLVRVLKGHTKWVLTLALSWDDKTLFSGSADTTIGVWSTDTGTLLRVLEGHINNVRSLALASDAKTLFSASFDKTIRQWSTDTGSLVRIIESATDENRCLALAPDGKTLFSGSGDNSIRQWIVDTGSLVRVSEGHSNKIRWILPLSCDNGKSLLSGSWDQSMRKWCIDTGSLIGVQTDTMRSAALTPDGKRLFSGGNDGDHLIRQWSTDTGALVRVLEGHTSAVTRLMFSPNVEVLFSLGAEDQLIRLWSVETGSLLHVLEGHTSTVTSLTFSPDSKTVFSLGSSDILIRQWSIETGLLRVLQGHEHAISCLVLSLDGKSLFSGSHDGDIREWSVDSGNLIRVLQGHEFPTLTVTFDGKILLSRHSDDPSDILKWSVDTGAPYDGDLPVGSYSFPGDDDSGSVGPGLSRFPVKLPDGSVLSVSGKTIIHRSSSESGSIVLWSSSPWLLSAQNCKLDSTTRVEQRTRLLLHQCGAQDIAAQQQQPTN